jgi:hypothetical protein
MVSPPTTCESIRRTAPSPSQMRSPSASCSASAWRHPILRTNGVPSPARAGATQAATPPGSNGGPTVSVHRSAIRSTTAGSAASHR